MGRLTSDPELRQTQSGIASCRFTVAVDRRFADKATGERQADFISCTAWRQTAEFVAKYFTKGKMIALEGSLRNNNYQDKNHPDITHYTMDVLVDNVEFCGDRGGNGGGQAQTAPQQQQAAQNIVNQAQAAGLQTEQFDLSQFEEILGGDVPF